MFEWLYAEENKSSRKKCFAVLSEQICSYDGKVITSEKEFVDQVLITYSWFTNYYNIHSCLAAITRLGFRPCKEIKDFWINQVKNMGFLITSEKNLWDEKSFNADKCLETLQNDSFNICHKDISMTDPMDTALMKIWINNNPDDWKITIPYQNETANLTDLCLEKFQTKGFMECKINDPEPTGEIMKASHNEL